MILHIFAFLTKNIIFNFIMEKNHNKSRFAVLKTLNVRIF